MTSPKSPISPEERARAACTEAGWLNPCAVPCKEGEDCDCEKERSVIAQAIRQAENDALERAVEAITLKPYTPLPTTGLGIDISRREAIEAIRSLKHKDTP